MVFFKIINYFKENKLVVIILLLPLFIWYTPFRFWYIFPFTLAGAFIGYTRSRDSCINSPNELCGFGESFRPILIMYLIAYILPFFITTAVFLVRCKNKPVKEKIIVLLTTLLINILILVFPILQLLQGGIPKP
jgi:hypothetical protein